MAEAMDYDSFDAELLAKIEGTRLSVGYHNPFLATDPGLIWLVLHGSVDIYAVPLEDGKVVGTGTHLVRIEAGELVFGMAPVAADGTEIGLRAVAVMGTELFRARRSDIEDEDFDLIVVDWIDRWVGQLAAALVPVGDKRSSTFLEAEPEMAYGVGTVLVPQRGDVIWVCADIGEARVLDRMVPQAGLMLPVSGSMWVTCDTDCTLSPVYTPTALFRGVLWRSLDLFHALAMDIVADMLSAEDEAEAERLSEKAAVNRTVFSGALQRIGSILHAGRKEERINTLSGAADPLYEAMRMVGAASGLDIVPPSRGDGQKLLHPMDAIARRSRVRTRRIVLFDGWHKRDNGPVVAFLGERKTPVALLPTGEKSYRMVDPATGVQRPVDDRLVAELTGEGYVLYRPFPTKPLRVRDVFLFGFRGLRKDFAVVGAMGLLGGLIALATPVATGALFSSIVPRADIDMHLMVIAGLVLAAFGTAVFSITRAVAMLRIETRMDASIQTAVWDRLMSLPVPFFRNYSSGDLADRANGINAIRQILTGSATETGLNVIFSLFSLVLLFWYSWQLALIAVLIVVVMLGASIGLTLWQIPLQREMIGRGGKIEGLVFQLLTGITKLRVSASEPRAFARWAEEFSISKTLTYRVRRIAALQAVLNSGFPVVASIILFASIMLILNAARPDSSFGVGSFLAFNAAFGQFTGAMMALLGTVTTLVAIVPLYERVDPILKAQPEVSEARADPGQIEGAVEFSHVSFRYDPETPPIVDDVSLSIPQGSYVAFVGPSGSGKSTLVRLLLGFEAPESGGVYIDGKDLTGLDMPSVRRQIGVVLQNGRLMSGSIFDNIVGSLPLTQDDAWDAARLAGFAEDVEAMPMGMHTVLSEGAGTLSGGQRQRLMIARALVHKPRILILDEATSALDNRTQEIVNASLARMNMTRIVVAHRLSTIENVDRIFVMRQGRLVEEGDFNALMALGGEFSELARRQMV